MSDGRAAAGALVVASAVLLCLIPRPEGDLFFALRTGADLLRAGHLPHADAYSWSRAGARWDVPEWGAFALYALAYRAGALTGAGGLLGTWALMAALAAATAGVAWGRLSQCVGAAWAFPLASLMLLALSPCLQERPYAFSYLLLAVSLALLTRGREDGPPPDRPPAPNPGGVGGPRPGRLRSPRNGGLGGDLGHGHALLWLPPLCAVWTNLHQGVVVLPLLLLVYAAGDVVVALSRGYETPGRKVQASFGRRTSARRAVALPLPGVSYPRTFSRAAWARAARMGLLAGACGLAVMASPYGAQVYGNVFLTLRDPALMAHITEWEPAWSLPPGQSGPFLLLALLAVAGLARSRRRPRLPDALAVAALGAEALWHVRDVALFAVGSVILLAPHWGAAQETPPSRRGLRTPPAQETPPSRLGSPPPPAGEEVWSGAGLIEAAVIASPSSPERGGGEPQRDGGVLRPRRDGGVPNAGGVPPPRRAGGVSGVGLLLLVPAVLYVGTVGLVAAAALRRAGLGQASLGAAVAERGDYPGAACAFMDAEKFPSGLRLLNDLGDGGFVLWREPREPVFIDGRLDVYAGRTFDDNLLLVRADGSPAWAALVRRYDFDCVLTESRREAAAFAALPGSGADPGWQLVYTAPRRPGHPRPRLLLRRRPRFAALIARCLAPPPPN